MGVQSGGSTFLRVLVWSISPQQRKAKLSVSIKMLPSVGVFGTDHSARMTMSIFQSAGFTVSGVWGSTKEKAKSVATELEIPFYTGNMAELLLHSDVDIACVCCTPYQFAEVAVKALSIGKHVFCGTPAGLNYREAEKMITAALYYPKLLSLMNHPLRFLKCFAKAKELISEGYCGELFACECRIHVGSLVGKNYDWHCDRSMGGGILHKFGCHVIDILTFLTNQQASEAQGMLQTFVKHTNNMPSFRQITSDDFCSFHLRYPNGLCATITINSHLPGDFYHEILIVGSKGCLKLVNCDLFGSRNDSYNAEYDTLCNECRATTNDLDQTDTSLPLMYLRGLKLLIEGIKCAFNSTQNTDRKNADRDLIAAAADFEDGCYVRAVLDAIVESNENGQWAKVNIPVRSKNDNPFWTSAQQGPLPLQERPPENEENVVRSLPRIKKEKK